MKVNGEGDRRSCDFDFSKLLHKQLLFASLCSWSLVVVANSAVHFTFKA